MTIAVDALNQLVGIHVSPCPGGAKRPLDAFMSWASEQQPIQVFDAYQRSNRFTVSLQDTRLLVSADSVSHLIQVCIAQGDVLDVAGHQIHLRAIVTEVIRTEIRAVAQPPLFQSI